jgi:1,4-dihydroxy-2-naphthoate octaprenyltransferase
MMDSNKKPRDYKSLWMISLVLIALGIVLTINLSMLRAIGFVMLGIGGVGMIVSITNMDKWKDKESDDEEKRRFS